MATDQPPLAELRLYGILLPPLKWRAIFTNSCKPANPLRPNTPQLLITTYEMTQWTLAR